MEIEKIQKTNKFLEVVKKMQSKSKLSIGLLVLENGDDFNLISNELKHVKIIDNERDEDVEDVIDNMTTSMEKGQGICFKIGPYLDPKIYNQLHMLAQTGHMEYPTREERKFVYPSEGSYIVIVATDQDLEKLNYTNIFDIASLTERLS